MRRNVSLVILVAAAMLALPLAAGALGLDIEAKGGAGLGLGSTNNPNLTGSPGLSYGGGLNLDLYLFNVGPVDLGISAGAGYTSMSNHSVWNMQSPPAPFATTQTADSTYNYLTIPIDVVGRIPVGPVALNLKAGGFIAYFLSGSANLSYTVTGGPFQNGTETFDSSNTEMWMYGLHFAAGADIALSGSLSLAPSAQFYMGLTDVTVNNALSSYTDTLWSLTAMIGIKYKAF